VPEQTTRLTTLENHTRRLAERIARLEVVSQQFTWYRVAAFVAAGLLAWAGFSLLGGAWGWVFLALGIAGFGTVVALHARVRGSLALFTDALDLARVQVARLELDWAQIPHPPWMPGVERSGIEIDLDLTGPSSLHHLLDVSLSRQGSQRLAGWLSQDTPDLDLVQRHQQLVRELAPLTRFRSRLLLNARHVARDPLDGDRFLEWLATPQPGPRLNMLLALATLLVAINWILFLGSITAGWPNYWILMLILYLGFYFTNSGFLEEFLESVVHMDSELDKLRSMLHYLERYPLKNCPGLRELCSPIRDQEPRPSRLLGRIKQVTAGAGLRMNPVIGLALNVALPWDFLVAFLARRVRGTAALLIPGWLDTLYTLEALTGLANFADLNRAYCLPELAPSAQPVFKAGQLGHPLLPPAQRVCNDFSISDLGGITIITGSNMAGKSTFLKTIGINLCLAYAGGPVNAACLRFRPFRLHTCMRINDSLADGVSYFYAEVKCLKALLLKIREPGAMPVLFLVDEIFRGTNNRERLIGSQAYIHALIEANGIGFLATHDLELANLAEVSPKILNFHFREEVSDGRLVFDYQVRPGPSPTTNALKIMRMEGLPVDLPDLPGD
jgi:MutS domain V